MYSLICERSLFYSHKVGKVACGVCVYLASEPGHSRLQLIGLIEEIITSFPTPEADAH